MIALDDRLAYALDSLLVALYFGEDYLLKSKIIPVPKQDHQSY